MSAGRCKLESGTNPARPSLSEAAIADMESFLDQTLMVLPAVRVDIFDRGTRPSVTNRSTGPVEESPEFELTLKKEGIKATASLINGEFVVKEGSLARRKWIGDLSKKTSYWQLYDQLVEQGILTKSGQNRVFTENFAFSSTSAAGAVINGRSTAGPIA